MAAREDGLLTTGTERWRELDEEQKMFEVLGAMPKLLNAGWHSLGGLNE